MRSKGVHSGPEANRVAADEGVHGLVVALVLRGLLADSARISDSDSDLDSMASLGLAVSLGLL